MRRVFDASNIMEANILKGLLAQYGIQADVSGYYLQGGIGEIPVAGTIFLWVEDEDEDRARSIIEEYSRG